MNLKKKIGTAAGVCLFLLAACVFAPAAWALDTWDGSIATDYAGGTGTEADPYIIETGAQLRYFADQVNTSKVKSGTHFKLEDDIDLNGSYYTWTPIGKNSSYSFYGRFDGNGRVISNMKVSQSASFAGLFGRTSSTARIENVALAKVNVTGESSAAALVGSNRGNISNCVVTGQISGTNYVGGLAGYNSYDGGSIINSMSSCSVTGRTYVGGLVGDNDGTVSNSISNGSAEGTDYVGGLFGSHSGGTTASNNIAAGRFQQTSHAGPITGSGSGIITASVYDAQGTGYTEGTDSTKKTTAELTTGSEIAGLGGDWTYASGYYPRPKALEVRGAGVRAAAAFAAVPVYLSEGNTTARVTGSFSVPTKTADDTPLTWSANPPSAADISQTTGAVTPKTVGLLALTGRTTLHEKTFLLTVTNVAAGPYTVTFDAAGGSPEPDDQTVPAGQKATEPANPTKSGYVFDGWYDESSNSKWNFAATVTRNLDLTARWKTGGGVVYHTVTFDSAGGSDVSGQTVQDGGTVRKPANPTAAGYTFVGWYKDDGYTQPWDFDTPVTSDITLYAGWKEAGGETVGGGGGGCDSFGLGLGILILAAGALSKKGKKR